MGNTFLRDINDGSNVTINDRDFNNKYSQKWSQSLFNSIMSDALINLLLLGQEHYQFNYLNHYNLLKLTWLNLNTNTNSNRNTQIVNIIITKETY